MENTILPKLNKEEVRVLGSLVEKSRVTPDYYPMTLNGLKSACNQKTSRSPVMDMSEDMIIKTLDSLKKKGLVAVEIGGRVMKYRHTLLIKLPLRKSELSVLCLLMLRGPLTPGEINSNSGRLYNFESIENVLEILRYLSEMEPPFVKNIGKQPGQSAERFAHLFSEVEIQIPPASSDSGPANLTEIAQLKDKISGLEERIAALEDRLSAIDEQGNK